MAKQVVFIHGGETFDTYEEYLAALAGWEFDPYLDEKKRWKRTMMEHLGEEWELVAPTMPSKFNAKYHEWKIWFEKVVPFIKPGAFLIGHSLGGIFLAKYLAEHDLPVRTAAVILVAAPYDSADSTYSLADFALPESLERLAHHRIILYHSKDDTVVPFTALEKYRQALPGATIHVFKDRGHFMQEEFPELVAELQRLG